MKHNLLGIDACFECQNDAVSKILRVTNRQTNIMITLTLCACAEDYLGSGDLFDLPACVAV